MAVAKSRLFLDFWAVIKTVTLPGSEEGDMKKLLCVLALLLLPVMAFAADKQGMVFCDTFDEHWKPVNENTQFGTLSVSFIAHVEKSFGIPKITMTVYKVVAEEETLLKREDMDINPTWDTFGVRYLALPDDGVYNIALTTPEGGSLVSGKVTISKAAKGGEVKKQETLGTRLEKLFNKYAPKK